MTPPPSLSAPVLPRRPQHQRVSERLVLKGALDRRDGGAVAWLSLRWVHRHGVEALPPLMQELTAGDASLKGWWHDHLHAAPVPAAAAGPSIAVDVAVAAADGGAAEAAVDPAAQAFASAAAAACEEAAPGVASAVELPSAADSASAAQSTFAADSASTADSTSSVESTSPVESTSEADSVSETEAALTVASGQAAQGFSFAEITLEAGPQEVEESSAELVLSFAEVAGLEPAVPCGGSADLEPVPALDMNAGAEAQISPVNSAGADPVIGSEGATSSEPAAEAGEAAHAPIEFLGEPLAFDPWLDAPPASIPLAESPAEPSASRTEPPADDAASEPMGQDGSIEGVAPATTTPQGVSVSATAPVADDPGAEALSAAAPAPGDQALDGFAQGARPVPEFSFDPVTAHPGTAVPPLIPARPAAAGVFNFGADSVVTAPQPAWPPSGEATAAGPAADPESVAPAADLQAVAPVVEPAGAEAPDALATSLPAESSPTQPEAPEPAQAPIWRRPLARVKNLVRVCVEEVVSTFQTMDGERNTVSAGETVSASDNASASNRAAGSEAVSASNRGAGSERASTSSTSATGGPAQLGDTFQPRGSGQARGSAAASPSPTGQLPPLDAERPAGPTRRSATEIAPELTPQGRTPPLRERAAAAVAGRPAPAPSHPGLASLRSWLPDDSATEDTRSS